MNTPLVSAIIVSYNDQEFIGECLESLIGTYPNLEIIIKNQKSETSEEAYSRISQKYPQVIVINGDNNGLSAGFNDGVKNSHGEYLLFLGGDARVKKDTIKLIVEYMDNHSDVGAATAKLILSDGSLDMDAHRAFPSPWISFSRLFGLQRVFPNNTLFNQYFLPDRDMSKPHEVDLCISHFMMVRRKVYDQINGFDEKFFLYGEDVDFCYRIKEAGWKIMYLSNIEAVHLKGVSVGIRNTTRKLVNKPLAHRLKMQRLTTEAMSIFLKKHYFKKYPAILVYFMLFGAWVLGWIRVVMEYLK